MIKKQAFGRAGHMSTRTLFGAAALGRITPAEADRTLEVLLEYGVNHIDTAASYGDAELRIGPWMDRHRQVQHLHSAPRWEWGAGHVGRGHDSTPLSNQTIDIVSHLCIMSCGKALPA